MRSLPFADRGPDPTLDRSTSALNSATGSTRNSKPAVDRNRTTDCILVEAQAMIATAAARPNEGDLATGIDPATVSSDRALALLATGTR